MEELTFVAFALLGIAGIKGKLSIALHQPASYLVGLMAGLRVKLLAWLVALWVKQPVELSSF